VHPLSEAIPNCDVSALCGFRLDF